MTVSTNKNGVPTSPETTKSNRAVQTPTTNNITKYWVLEWHSYAHDPYYESWVPLETKESIHYIKPDPSEIYYLRKHMHAAGFKLVGFDEVEPEPVDEF